MLRAGEVPYQAIIFLSRKNPPVGPPSSRVAIQTAVSAPSAVDRSASAPPISVRTHPGHIEFTRMFVPIDSYARTRVTAFRAAFEIR